MFVVEILDGTEWKQASEHTVEADAHRQAGIFQAGGTPVDQIRVTQKGDGNE